MLWAVIWLLRLPHGSSFPFHPGNISPGCIWILNLLLDLYKWFKISRNLPSFRDLRLLATRKHGHAGPASLILSGSGQSEQSHSENLQRGWNHLKVRNFVVFGSPEPMETLGCFIWGCLLMTAQAGCRDLGKGSHTSHLCPGPQVTSSSWV